MSERTPRQYEGTVVKVGNSRGMRLPAGFFQAHPEFNGKVQLTMVGDGAALLSALPCKPAQIKDEEADPVLSGLLAFLQAQMAAKPADIVAADDTQLRRIGKLVEGVALD